MYQSMRNECMADPMKRPLNFIALYKIRLVVVHLMALSWHPHSSRVAFSEKRNEEVINGTEVWSINLIICQT